MSDYLKAVELERKHSVIMDFKSKQRSPERKLAIEHDVLQTEMKRRKAKEAKARAERGL